MEMNKKDVNFVWRQLIAIKIFVKNEFDEEKKILLKKIYDLYPEFEKKENIIQKEVEKLGKIYVSVERIVKEFQNKLIDLDPPTIKLNVGCLKPWIEHEMRKR